MKKILAGMIAALAFSCAAIGATVDSFCPQEWNEVGFDGNGILKVWGVSELSGKPLLAVPNDVWPRFMAVAGWRDSLIRAKERGSCVKIHCDSAIYHESNSGIDGHRIWEVVE